MYTLYIQPEINWFDNLIERDNEIATMVYGLHIANKDFLYCGGDVDVGAFVVVQTKDYTNKLTLNRNKN